MNGREGGTREREMKGVCWSVRGGCGFVKGLERVGLLSLVRGKGRDG